MKTILSKIRRAIQVWWWDRQIAHCERKAKKILKQTKGKYPNSDGIFAVSPIWPAVSGRDPGFTIKGQTTIMWGTPGILASPAPAPGSISELNYYAVLRANQRPIVERNKLPTGAGATSSDVFLQDGVTMELTVRDDSRMQPPVIGTVCTIVDVAGLIGVTGGNPLSGVTYSARVVDTNYEIAVKQPGERVLVLDNLVLIDSQTTAAQASA